MALNSHLCNHQQVKTLIRTVQIQKWYKYDPSVSVNIGLNGVIESFSQAPKKKPTVRWCDISSTIFASKQHKWNTAEKDDGSVDDFQGKAFDISRTVNLDSGDLADVLSDKATPVLRKAIAMKTPAPVAAPKVLSEEYWEM